MLKKNHRYRYKRSVAVPTGHSINPRAFWVHIMGPDFAGNGIFALYSETGKFLGGYEEKLDDIKESDEIIEEELDLEEEIEFGEEELAI